MEQTAEIIYSTLQANGGVCDWDVLLDAVGYENRRYLLPAMELLEQQGRAKRVNYKHPEKGWIMDVQLIGATS